MDLKELFTEDRGVSPVIGVILMVAITVILAAVIGAFVLGLGDRASQSAPSASFSYDFQGDTNVTITHDGGENIDNSTIDVTLGGEPLYESGEVNDDNLNYSDNGWSDPISTGKSIEFAPDENEVDTQGETVRIIWNAPGGDSSNTLSDRRWS